MAGKILNCRHLLMDDKTLAGGQASAAGASVVWAMDPDEESGAGPETLTAMLIERLRFLQTTLYRCDEYEAALARAVEIEAYLTRRRQERRERGVEGTQQP